jgi:hypothetical protein
LNENGPTIRNQIAGNSRTCRTDRDVKLHPPHRSWSHHMLGGIFQTPDAPSAPLRGKSPGATRHASNLTRGMDNGRPRKIRGCYSAAQLESKDQQPDHPPGQYPAVGIFHRGRHSGTHGISQGPQSDRSHCAAPR